MHSKNAEDGMDNYYDKGDTEGSFQETTVE